MTKKFRILSLDGGGLRGIVPVMVLEHIEKVTGKKIIDLFDLIAGTSTGGLITTALTVSDDMKSPKFSLQDIKDIYIKRGHEIFPHKNYLGRFWSGFNSLINPEYSAHGLSNALNELLGEKRITDCLKPIFVTAYDLHNNDPLFFKTRYLDESPGTNARLYDICRATSAGPTYLPAHSFFHDGKQVTCIDGGVFMNNPSLGALVEATRYSEYYDRKDLALKDIHVLSLGTGNFQGAISQKQALGWGKMQWIRPLIDIMMYGVNQATSYQANELLNKANYMRIPLVIGDKKYTDMADSRPQTRNYLMREVENQLFRNKALMDKLDEFLKNMES